MTPPKGTTIAIIGLGACGLPLAVKFGKKYPLVGFDGAQVKIDANNRYIDPSGEVISANISTAVSLGSLESSTDPRRLATADFLVITVPAPVDNANTPDFGPALPRPSR